jgi:erythromycin esterase
MNRRSRWAITPVICITLATPLLAQHDDLEARVTWLAANAIRLRSIDPDDSNFTDLEPLRDVIGNAPLVMLGEQTHGDGATFHAKTRLIKFLHQELGFDVLAFEGSFHGMRKVWETLQQGADATPALRGGVPRAWTESAQFEPLADYIAARARTHTPLEVAGFDCQFGRASRESLVDELAAIAQRLEPALVRGATWDTLRAALDSLVGGAYFGTPIPPTQHQRVADWLTALAQAIEAAGPERADDESAYWRQLLESTAAQTDAIATWDSQNDDQPEYGHIRDAQMARNLVWLVRQQYAGRKIVVWAATYHIMRNPRTIDTQSDDWSYDSVTVMGHKVWEDLGDNIYVVGFTAHRGNWGHYRSDPQELAPPPPGSIEDLFGRTPLDNAYLDLRHLKPGGEWLREQLVMRPLGYRPMKADWTQVMDAVIFTRTMYPSSQTSR